MKSPACLRLHAYRPHRLQAGALGLGALLFLTLGSLGALTQHLLEDRATTAYPAPGQLISVGTHRLHLHCQGQGSPLVVMESGLSGWSQDWSRVQPGVARHTTTCTYDRAGYAWSDEVTPAPTGQEAVEDLRGLLRAAHQPGPVVLVGHSLGGLLVQIFAQTHPDEVAGLVLVDSLHHDMTASMPAEAHADYIRHMDMLTRSATVLAPLGAARLANMPASIILEKLPVSTQPSARAWAWQSKNYRALRNEFLGVDAALEAARYLPPLPAVPTAILSSHGMRDLPPRWDSEEMRRHWVAGQQALAHDTTAKHQEFPEAGHYLQLEQPEAVIQAVLEVVQQARKTSVASQEPRTHAP